MAPEDIDVVIYTHLHLDHVGWTSDVALGLVVGATQPPSITFPKTRHVMSEAEWPRWTQHSQLGGSDAAAVLRPLTGVLEFGKDGDQLADGVNVKVTGPATAPVTSSS